MIKCCAIHTCRLLQMHWSFWNAEVEVDWILSIITQSSNVVVVSDYGENLWEWDYWNNLQNHCPLSFSLHLDQWPEEFYFPPWTGGDWHLILTWFLRGFLFLYLIPCLPNQYNHQHQFHNIVRAEPIEIQIKALTLFIGSTCVLGDAYQ